MDIEYIRNRLLQLNDDPKVKTWIEIVKNFLEETGVNCNKFSSKITYKSSHIPFIDCFINKVHCFSLPIDSNDLYNDTFCEIINNFILKNKLEKFI